jgi:putative glutamine transport system permease protein
MTSLFNWSKWLQLLSDGPTLLTFVEGLKITIFIAIAGLLLAMALGIVFGFMSVAKNKILRIISRIYVELYQNTPLLLQTFFYYYSIPALRRSLFGMSIRDARLSGFIYGILGVGLYHGAYMAEVIRTGIEAVPKGQTEAAQSQGFTLLQTMIHVILPQTFRMIMPPLTNQALNLVKNTSVVALISGFDLMYYSNVYVTKGGNLNGYVLCAIMYFIICLPLAQLSKHLELKATQVPDDKATKKVVKGEVA